MLKAHHQMSRASKEPIAAILIRRSHSKWKKKNENWRQNYRTRSETIRKHQPKRFVPLFLSRLIFFYRYSTFLSSLFLLFISACSFSFSSKAEFYRWFGPFNTSLLFQCNIKANQKKSGKFLQGKLFTGNKLPTNNAKCFALCVPPEKKNKQWQKFRSVTHFLLSPRCFVRYFTFIEEIDNNGDVMAII